MPRGNTRNLDALVRSIARATLKAVGGEILISREMKKLQARIRKLEGEVRRQGSQLSRPMRDVPRRPRGRPQEQPGGLHGPWLSRTSAGDDAVQHSLPASAASAASASSSG